MLDLNKCAGCYSDKMLKGNVAWCLGRKPVIMDLVDDSYLISMSFSIASLFR